MPSNEIIVKNKIKFVCCWYKLLWLYNKVEKKNSRRMDYSVPFKCYGDACKNVWIVIKNFT